MTYPNFKDKYLQEALFHPKDFVNYKKWEKVKFPKKYILIYQNSVKRYFLKKYKPKKYFLYSLLSIYVYKDIGLVKVSGIGSPLSSSILEELIALGGKKFLSLGTAGGLHHEGVFLCNKALRDEGTSHHYLPKSKFAYPDKILTSGLGKSIKKIGLDFFIGATWTIDAPYRETKAKVEKYSKQGISTVEMESSALFSVAEYRKVQIACAFVVSDILTNKTWTPKFHKLNLKKTLNKLLDASVICLTK